MECIGYLEENNTLRFVINDECHVIRGGGILYAFYIFHNGTRIITRWYEAAKEIRIHIIGEGLYYAVGFIKKNDSEPAIITSLPVQVLQDRQKFELPTISVSIFGSCVSRDLMECAVAQSLTLDQYFARQSMISSVSVKVPVESEDIHLDSAFQKRQVYYDFNKSFMDMLQIKVSDYLIIDLVDERFPLVKYLGSYVTRSGALLQSGIIGENVIGIEKEEYVDASGKLSYKIEGIDVRIYIDRFCDKILGVYKPEKIILHVVKGAEFYRDLNMNIKRFEPNTAGYFKRLNKMWSFMYEYLGNKFKGCIYIDISMGYLADEGHVWGLSPIHFQKEYYEEVWWQIASNIRDRDGRY